MWKVQGIIGLAAVLITAGSIADPVQISVTGTADSTAMGYASGQSYTFIWTINDRYTGSPDDVFQVTQNRWSSEFTSDPLLWADVSGDGLVGTYSRPSALPHQKVFEPAAQVWIYLPVTSIHPALPWD